ncbi:MAG TPA: Spy/CpxP family protein refolding chaperone [Tepidisphaeraceae bacterium]|nr:Spy/CpxP family protein refolding chaperone [Tepidisphaeraceae bacterium]
MVHSNLVLLSTAAVVMGAGVMVGRVTAQYPRQDQHLHQLSPGGHGHSWIDDQLNLTPDQKQKMDAIWDQTRKKMQAIFDGRHTTETDRDQAMRQLLTPDQWAQYQKINDQFRAKRDEQFKERNKLIQEANEASRALLDDTQQKKWDALTKLMRERHGPPGGFDQRPTTKPTEGADGSRA